MNKHRIEVGDRVKVQWETIESIEGEVLHTPQDVGDAWIILNQFTGKPVNVCIYSRMTLEAKGAKQQIGG